MPLGGLAGIDVSNYKDEETEWLDEDSIDLDNDPFYQEKRQDPSASFMAVENKLLPSIHFYIVIRMK